MRIALALLTAFALTASAAETFVPARIVDLQNASAMKADTVGRALGAGSAAVTQDNYLQIVFETSDRRVTARTFAMGGGTIWAMNHPEALLVGSDVSIAFEKRGVLLVKVPGRELKLSVQRMEIINQAQ
jgi:hypothetical protein